MSLGAPAAPSIRHLAEGVLDAAEVWVDVQPAGSGIYGECHDWVASVDAMGVVEMDRDPNAAVIRAIERLQQLVTDAAEQPDDFRREQLAVLLALSVAQEQGRLGSVLHARVRRYGAED